MDLSMHYEIDHECLFVHVMGMFSPGAAPGLIRRSLDVAKENGVEHVLCDLTAVDGLDAEHLPVITRFETAGLIARSLPRQFRLAFLEKPEQIPYDRFDENVMVNRGARVKVTTDLNEAMEWLGVGQVPRDGVSP